MMQRPHLLVVLLIIHVLALAGTRGAVLEDLSSRPPHEAVIKDPRILNLVVKNLLDLKKDRCLTHYLFSAPSEFTFWLIKKDVVERYLEHPGAVDPLVSKLWDPSGQGLLESESNMPAVSDAPYSDRLASYSAAMDAMLYEIGQKEPGSLTMFSRSNHPSTSDELEFAILQRNKRQQICVRQSYWSYGDEPIPNRLHRDVHLMERIYGKGTTIIYAHKLFEDDHARMGANVALGAKD